MRNLLLIILVIILALLVVSAFMSRGAIGGGAESSNNKRKSRGRKFESVAGPREGLKVQKDVELKPKTKLTSETVEKVINEINATKTFAPLNGEEKKSLDAAAKKLKVPEDTVESMRHIVVSQRIANRVGEVIENSDSINKSHSEGKTIVEIANEKKLPPVAVARQILMSKGSSINEVREMLRGDTPIPDKDLAKQVQDAIKMDHGGKPSMEKIFNDSEKFEKKTGDWLKKSGVSFKTEQDLKEQQIADPRFGRPVATPDFFFENPIKLNGNLVNWLDAKNFPLFNSDNLTEGAHGPKLLKSMAYQASKYNRNFGRGAFLFAHGIQDGVKLETKKGPIDVDLVDGSGI